jgi:hypothetical protein
MLIPAGRRFPLVVCAAAHHPMDMLYDHNAVEDGFLDGDLWRAPMHFT